MLRVLAISLAVIIFIHGLIHLLGFVAYWPLATLSEIPYKTTLLGGRLDIGAAGMKVYALLWLLAALGFVFAAVALALRKPIWAPFMLAAALLSLVLCILDWEVAWRGALIDLALLLVLGVVFGLRIEPAPLPPYTAPAMPLETIPLPAGLPEPVERFYHLTYGDQVPVYTSAVISGRGGLRFMGITFPARWRFSHLAGQDYRHYIEATFYGLPIMKVNEHYLDGHSRLALPFGVVENDPGVDSAANQGLWGETMFFPAVFLTDQRTRWEAVDEKTAKLTVPFGEDEQVFTVDFDQQTGLMTRMETLRYRDAKVGKLRWWGEVMPVNNRTRRPVTRFAVTWEDEGTPWLVIQIEDIVFNSDINSYVRQTGP